MCMRGEYWVDTILKEKQRKLEETEQGNVIVKQCAVLSSGLSNALD